MVKIILEQENNKLEKETLDKMQEVLTLALQKEKVNSDSTIEVSLSMVDENRIRELNEKFREIDKATDVLSFPQFESPQEINELINLNKDMPVELGDVVICQEVASRQADEFGHSVQREMVYLFAHSILHLLGYDHMNDEDKSEMRAIEKELMREINLLK